MKEKTVGVYCPSYRRSDCIMTQNILNDVTYVVRASEEEAYRNAGVRKLISAPDEEINTMSKVRQWILDNSPEDIIIQVDDDIKQILYRTDIVMEIKDPDVIDMEFLRIAQLLSDLKLGYATITVTSRPYLYQEEFKFNSMGGGIYWYNKECYKAKNDDKADCKEDVDKILQELMYNRIILMPKYLAMYVKTDTNEGGDNINKNSKVIRECNEYMKLKWGNSWTPLTLENERKWSTLVHPRDVQQTNQVTTISNITRVFNEEQKFPEMDAYTISKIYADWTAAGEAADTTVLTAENILAVYDKMLEEMSEGRVPKMGLLLYVNPATNTLIKNAQGIYRTLDVGKQNQLSRAIKSLDEVQIEEVPSELMKTLYDFTQGWKVAGSAKQINMMLINPLAVITPVSYEFSKLDPPSALSEGKYVYYEESHEDVFVLKNKKKAIRMSVEA